jgi:hypothetical protein
MDRTESSQEAAAAGAAVSPFSAADVEEILREQGWLGEGAGREMQEWLRDAAEWLGLQAARNSGIDGREALAQLLGLVFDYDARELMESKENQAVMAREGARDVVREMANRVLQGGNIDSERFRQIVSELKAIFGSHGRKIFYPLRLALAGRVGEGELDRVILLLDRASKLPLKKSVKGTRERMLEFCAALV